MGLIRRFGIPLLVVALASGAQLLIKDDFNAPSPLLAQRGDSPAPREPIRQAGLYLVPMDRTPRPLVADVGRRLDRVYGVRHRILGRAHGVRHRILPRLRSHSHAYDSDREQLVGDALLTQLAHTYPVSTQAAAVIGLTDADLYWAGASGDKFAFGVVHEDGYGVISSARMDPRNYGDDPDQSLLEERIEKMTARYLARLVFDLQPTSANEESVVRDSIRGLDDLDEMTNRICPDRPHSLNPC